MKRETAIAVGLTGLVTAVAIPTCVCTNAYQHFMSRSEQTRDIGTADYVLENYRWFKKTESQISQIDAQIISMNGEIAGYQKQFVDREGKQIPITEWSFDAREELARKQAVLRGYTSQYNMVIGDYNTRVSDISRKWTKGDEPEEMKPFLRTYEKKE